MPLLVFQASPHDVDVRSATRELIGQQLRKVFVAQFDQPPAGPLAECLRRIEEREAGQSGFGDGQPRPTDGD